MARFAKGARVRVKTDYPRTPWRGMIGTVLSRHEGRHYADGYEVRVEIGRTTDVRLYDARELEPVRIPKPRRRPGAGIYRRTRGRLIIDQRKEFLAEIRGVIGELDRGQRWSGELAAGDDVIRVEIRRRRAKR